MKKMFKLLMCAAVITAGFTACSEEVIPINPDLGGSTETGLLTINFSNPTPMTYASGDKDGNATDDERMFSNVTILVFNTQGLCKVDTTIPFADLKPDATAENKYKAVDIVVPLGDHNVYAGVNLTPDMRSTLGVKGTSNGVMKYVNLGSETVPSLDEIKKLYVAKLFPMFSSELKPITIKPMPAAGVANPNEVTIPLDRLVAKISVRKGEQFDISHMENLTAAGAIFNPNINWSMGNLNGKIYPYGKANFGHDPNHDNAPAELKKPEGGPVDYITQNFVHDFNTTGASFSNWTGFDLAADENGTAVASRKPKYAPENNVKMKARLGESTFAVVRAKFAPEKIYTYAPGDNAPTEVTTGYAPDTTASEPYYVVNSTQVYYFASETDAKAYETFLNSPLSKMKTYQGQYCFYRLMLGKEKNEKGNTVRNTYYLLTVNKFTGLGDPTAEIPDDKLDNTTDNEALLNVTLTINQWNPIEQDEVLGD